VLYRHGRDRSPLASEPGSDPPRTTWFDDLNATRPASLEPVDVPAHDASESSSMGGLKSPAHGIAGLSR
jgi:hypothetical protein